jgi:alanyl-tRNA synthetase
VFIQFNREQGGALKPLPARHVDTGMGLERLVSVLQGRRSNYDTDLWTPLFAAIQKATGARPYGGVLQDNVDISYRVIADHVRCLSSAIADGAAPGADGRNYVLRRILRRAARMGHQYLGAKGPFIHQVVPAVVESLGGVFPELKARQAHVTQVIHDEETAFGRTLERGLELFAQAAERAKAAHGVIGAEDAFRLHDTMGFPVDLTSVMAQERGLKIDQAGYEALMRKARETSRAAAGSEHRITLTPDAIEKLRTLGVKPTDIAPKHAARAVTSRVEAIWDGKHLQEHASGAEPVAVITRRTCFHAEGGGQVADTGMIVADHPGATLSCTMDEVDRMAGGVHAAADASLGMVGDMHAARGHGDTRDVAEFKVESVQEEGGFVLHIGRVTRGRLNRGDSVILDLARGHRRHVAAHHTGTHLLNWALRQVLGDEVQQRGSLVADDRLRFDFSFGRAMTHEEIAKAEQLVQQAIARNLKVDAADAPLAAAKAVNGVRAVFGEKYPDPVRVVSIGATVAELLADPSNAKWRQCSVEFCGGTHLTSSGEAKRFAIVSEGALSAGVRRVMALAGVPAEAAFAAAKGLHERIAAAGTLEGAALVDEASAITTLSQELTLPASEKHALQAPIEALRERAKAARREGESAGREAAVASMHGLLASVSGHALVAQIDNADAPALLAALDVAKAKTPETAVLLVSPDPTAGKVAIAARVPPSLIAKGLKAGDWVKAAAQACGGSGGGKPDLAQAGGKDVTKVAEAIAAAKALAATIG